MPTTFLEISRVPELLSEILDHLSQKDVCSLLQTCKLIYPACYRHLWSILIFDETGRPWYPKHAVWIDGRKYGALADLIRRNGPLGFDHTRVLWLGELLFKRQYDDDIQTEDLRNHLMRLFETNSINLREVIVTYNAGAPSADTPPERLQLLLALKKFSESKSVPQFSIKIEARTIISFTTYFDPKIITHFRLYISPKDRSAHHGEHTFTDSGGPLSRNIIEFAKLLEQMVNLKSLNWRWSIRNPTALPPLETVSKHLERLQVAFSSLKNLRELDLVGFLFHPSFFVTPPESVRKLRLSKMMTPTWWRKFAACPFTNIESMAIISQQCDNPVTAFDGIRLADLNRFLLGDIACQGLKSLWVHNKGWAPRDLEQCLFRRNPSLDKESAMGIARLIASRVATESSQILKAKSSTCWSVVSKLTPPRLLDGPVESLMMDLAQEFSGRFAGNADISLTDLDISPNEWHEFGRGARAELKRQLDETIGMVLHEYMHNFPTPQDTNRQDFVKDCIRRLGGFSANGTREWSAKKREVEKFAYKWERRMEGEIFNQQMQMTKELVQRIMVEGDLDAEKIANERIPWLLRKLEQDLGSQDNVDRSTGFLFSSI